MAPYQSRSMLWQGAAWCPMGSDEQAEVSMSMGLAEASEVPVPLISEREVKLRMWIGCGGMTLEIVEHGLMDILWID